MTTRTERRTAEELLILKAARRWQTGGPNARLALRVAQLNAFAQVAADVLHMCMAPAGFEQVITNVSKRLPEPSGGTHVREIAAARRDEWERAFIKAVNEELI